MRPKKSILLRVILVIAAVACGLAWQIFGSFLGKVTGLADLEYIIGLLGFAVMGYLIYKWAIK